MKYLAAMSLAALALSACSTTTSFHRATPDGARLINIETVNVGDAKVNLAEYRTADGSHCKQIVSHVTHRADAIGSTTSINLGEICTASVSEGQPRRAEATGRITAQEVLLVSGSAKEREHCETNGLIARGAGSGALLFCQNKIWTPVGTAPSSLASN